MHAWSVRLFQTTGEKSEPTLSWTNDPPWNFLRSVSVGPREQYARRDPRDDNDEHDADVEHDEHDKLNDDEHDERRSGSST